MTSLANILAKGEDIGGLLQLLALAAVVIIAGAAKWLGNKLEKKQAEQQAAEQARRQRQAIEESQPRPPRQQAPQARRKKLRAPAPPPIVLEPAEPHGLVDAEVAMQSGSKEETYNWVTHKTMSPTALLISAGNVDLSDPDTLRQAIVYHELISLPKALRQEPEQWDV